MTVRVVTAPTVEPLTLAEAKTHLVIDTDVTADDTYIAALIQVAREYAENYTRRAFVQRTLELTLPYFDGYQSEIFLPQPPLQSVTSIKYLDADGVLTTIAAADYQVDTYSQPGRVKPAYLDSWPVVTRGDFNAVQIRYIAGYDSLGSPPDYAGNIPKALKQWMLLRVGGLYRDREPVIIGTIVAALPRDYVDGLLDALVVDLF
mgnify:CR=1 FL=1